MENEELMGLFSGRKAYKVVHPDWLPAATASLRKTLDLMDNGSLPKCLTKPMLVVPMRWVLRLIYGSNLKSAMALLWLALGGVVEEMHGYLYRFWRYRVTMHSLERDWNEMMKDLGDSAPEDDGC
jgi:hypothetical protein